MVLRSFLAARRGVARRGTASAAAFLAVTAGSDAGLPVGVTVGPATVCVLGGARTVQLVNSGTCLFQAVADGDATHRAALPVQATMAVTAQADDRTYTLPPVTGSPGSAARWS